MMAVGPNGKPQVVFVASGRFGAWFNTSFVDDHD